MVEQNARCRGTKVTARVHFGTTLPSAEGNDDPPHAGVSLVDVPERQQVAEGLERLLVVSDAHGAVAAQTQRLADRRDGLGLGVWTLRSERMRRENEMTMRRLRQRQWLRTLETQFDPYVSLLLRLV
eukprot:265967-Pleurochrysis_carterae.AAC.1